MNIHSKRSKTWITGEKWRKNIYSSNVTLYRMNKSFSLLDLHRKNKEGDNLF